jgi:hypothetical protein
MGRRRFSCFLSKEGTLFGQGVQVGFSLSLNAYSKLFAKLFPFSASIVEHLRHLIFGLIRVGNYAYLELDSGDEFSGFDIDDISMGEDCTISGYAFDSGSGLQYSTRRF